MGTRGRRQFLRAASSLAAGAALPAVEERPNILYILTDQQHWNMMSCMGNPWVKTPAMDSLAAEGVRFELAYASNPVCMPARTSMMSAGMPEPLCDAGQRAGAGAGERAAADAGARVSAGGYRTAFGGKTHWPRPMTAESIGFETITRDERDGLARRAADFLREKHTQPFLLVASFINPHDICYLAIDAYTKANQLPAMHPKSVVERQRVAEALERPAGVAEAEFWGGTVRCCAEPRTDEPGSRRRWASMAAFGATSPEALEGAGLADAPGGRTAG
jgi:choline-sulfatase